ncbi:MAG: hypothetical protein RLZZ571_994, partial [Actinomycetota bacterium]
MSYSNIESLFIDGKRVPSSSGEKRTILHPANAKPVGQFFEATANDTELAIKAARRAFDDGHWTSFSGEQRAKILDRVADILERDKELFAEAESRDTAKRIIEARYDLDDIISVFRYFAKQAPHAHEREVDTGRDGVRSTIVSEPVGVVAMITPWNYPLLQASWKIAPALATGCTFVIKPSELTPSTTSMLMDVLVEAGVPSGVANLVMGAGATAGGPLSTHIDVDMVSFTGGLVTGKRLMANASETVKKIALELGGKNPNIIFADSNLDAAIDNALTAVFLHSGQVCSAGTRLLVERSIHEKVAAEVARRADAIVLGGSHDENAETGALISAGHRDKIEQFVNDAVAEG